ncbi:uncharacterized protein LOC135844611 [Planococcus citri]|uniref:uncharacterized protein LOC135844611 n=1 Tax=Planococcus citri TaxID=170843 RepID=UPI0031F9879B
MCSTHRVNVSYLSKTMLPDLPSTIFPTIDKYVTRFGLSMKSWLKQHHNRIFYHYYENQNSVLKLFDDFVCDYTGAIDYLRTARRMMCCDRLDRYQKFAIACTYFFEYHIRGLWPLVSVNMIPCLDKIDFYKSPQWYYWIYCLQNELDEIPCTELDIEEVELMLNEFMPHNRPSIEYFWNRLPSENRMQTAVHIFKTDAPSFFRFILQKFDDQQLDEFVNENDCHELVIGLFKDGLYDEEWILSMWMYVQRVMNVDTFIEVVEGMLQSEAREPLVDEVDFNDCNDKRPKPKSWGDLCREIWTIPPIVKGLSAESLSPSDVTP